jgi:hypothetical protein
MTWLRREWTLVAKPLGKPRHRYEDNIKRDLKGKVCEGLEWFNATSALGLATASSEIDEPSGSI